MLGASTTLLLAGWGACAHAALDTRLIWRFCPPLQHTMAVDPQPPSQQQQAQQQPPYNHQGGAAPSAPSGAPQVAAPAPKFKLKLTLGGGNKLQGAGGVASPPGAPPQDAAAGAAGVPPQQPSQPPQQYWGPT